MDQSSAFQEAWRNAVNRWPC